DGTLDREPARVEEPRQLDQPLLGPAPVEHRAHMDGPQRPGRRMAIELRGSAREEIRRIDRRPVPRAGLSVMVTTIVIVIVVVPLGLRPDRGPIAGGPSRAGRRRCRRGLLA